MAINQNHLFEELGGIKCGIVEKNVSPSRLDFLKRLLEYNHFTVIAVPSPPQKTAAPLSAPAEGEAQVPINPPTPETFTVGITDITFNPINAIFGRLLQTPDGHIVTLAYWHQKESISRDDLPYFQDPAS
jgi:hypothetical protein